MSKRSDGSEILWFMAGVALGSTVALLFAPESGEETRARISKGVTRSRESLEEAGHEIAEKGRELYEKGREIADEAAHYFERGKSMVEEG